MYILVFNTGTASINNKYTIGNVVLNLETFLGRICVYKCDAFNTVDAKWVVYLNCLPSAVLSVNGNKDLFFTHHN